MSPTPEEYSITYPITDELKYYDETIELTDNEKQNIIKNLAGTRIEYVSYPSIPGIDINDIQLIHRDINNENSEYVLLSNAVIQLRQYAILNNILAEEISNTYSHTSYYYSTNRD
jgi:hypothetical protein